MSGRHNKPEHRSAGSRKRVAVAAGAGVAGIASLAAAAPLLNAGPAGAVVEPAAIVTTTSSAAPSTTVTSSTSKPRTTDPETTTTRPETTEPETTTTKPSTTDPETSTTTTTTTTSTPSISTTTISIPPIETTTTTSTPPLTAGYGLQKYRIGVERDSSSYIPDAINTKGTDLTVTVKHLDGTTESETCTTADATPAMTTDTTYCPGGSIGSGLGLDAVSAGSRVRPHAHKSEGSATSPFTYLAAPGDQITVAQKTVVDGLIKDSSSLTLDPCKLENGGCSSDPGSESGSTLTTDLIFTDPGLAPKTVDDTAKTQPTTPVTVDVAGNDFSYGSDDKFAAPVTGIDIAAKPGHGTATVEPAATPMARHGARTAAITSGAANITYTPQSGFGGVDTFKYTLRTKNGASTATVSVTVPGGTTSSPTSLAVDPTSDTRTPVSYTGSDALAATGTSAAPLLGYGLAMLGAGAGAVAVGRHRRRETARPAGRTH